ncbi:MAG TPA: glycosyltransferase family 2 protein [Pirellulaceae bacterium]|nr:glycosyltransferase family 2 protein [Pirellulaceae bacterium]
MRAKLTCLIPCKNEAANIEACIESLRPIADEILVADSGSTDETMEIVRQIGRCKLIEREFINYADFKNWAIPQAAHEWVLIVDADERLTPELAAEIRDVLECPPQSVDGYWIYRRSFFLGHEIKHCGWDTDCVFRLIRRDHCRYGDCRVHEEIFVPQERAGALKAKLLHYTYWSYDQYFAKYLRYTKWGALDMWDAGKRASFSSLLLRPFLRFLQLYILKLGFLDGLAGIQVCMLQAFFVSFVKQGRLWEMEHARPQPMPPQPCKARSRPMNRPKPREPGAQST